MGETGGTEVEWWRPCLGVGEFGVARREGRVTLDVRVRQFIGHLHSRFVVAQVARILDHLMEL